MVIGYLLYHEQKKGYLYGCVILTCKVSNVQVVSFPARTRPDAAAGVPCAASATEHAAAGLGLWSA